VTRGELSPSEGRIRSRRAGATFLFVAAAFGAMAMLSVPLARLIPSAVRPFFTFAPPVEGPLHPSRGSISGPRHEAGRRHTTSVTHPPRHIVRAVPPAASPVPSGPGSSLPVPFPADRAEPGPGVRTNGGRTLSDRDLQTLSVLNLLVDRFGFRVLMPLRDATDMRTSIPHLLALIARNGVSALPTRVAPPLVQALLGDLRQDLPRLVGSLRRPASPSPSRTARAPSRHHAENSSSKGVPPKRRHHEGKPKPKPKHRRPN
jgi:hypothetical protein